MFLDRPLAPRYCHWTRLIFWGEILGFVDHLCVVCLKAGDRTQGRLLKAGFAEEGSLLPSRLLAAALSRASLPAGAHLAVGLAAPLSQSQEVLSHCRQPGWDSWHLSGRQRGGVLQGPAEQACHHLAAEVWCGHGDACCLSEEDVSVDQGNLSDMVVEADVPLHGAVGETVVGAQLVSSVHSAHVAVVVLHTPGFDHLLVSRWPLGPHVLDEDTGIVHCNDSCKNNDYKYSCDIISHTITIKQYFLIQYK